MHAGRTSEPPCPSYTPNRCIPGLAAKASTPTRPSASSSRALASIRTGTSAKSGTAALASSIALRRPRVVAEPHTGAHSPARRPTGTGTRTGHAAPGSPAQPVVAAIAKRNGRPPAAEAQLTAPMQVGGNSRSRRPPRVVDQSRGKEKYNGPNKTCEWSAIDRWREGKGKGWEELFQLDGMEPRSASGPGHCSFGTVLYIHRETRRRQCPAYRAYFFVMLP